MITINLKGGLGNQLFQISTLISYMIDNNIPIFLMNQKETRKDRPFYWASIFHCLQPYIKNIYPKCLIYKELSFHYNKLPIFNITENIMLDGYFQSYKYFEHNKFVIFDKLQLLEQKKHIIDKYSTEYKFKNTISLHFRIGDYKKYPDYHTILPIHYYTSAITYIMDTTKQKKVNILCVYELEDEEIIIHKMNEIQNTLSSKYNMNIMMINTKIPDYEQMLIMSECNYNIIANSTFSWWSAYLNAKEDKIVCYPNPKYWFGKKFKTYNLNDLFPPEWKKIKF